MRGTLVMLCILLFLWIGGSSFFYMCKINDYCNAKEEVVVDIDEQVEVAKPVVDNKKVAEIEEDIEQPEEDENKPEVNEQEEKVVGKEVTEKPSTSDSVAIAREYIRNNPSRTIYFDYAKHEKGISPEDKEFFNMLRLYVENEPDKGVYVTGHSDSIGTPEGLIFASYRRVVFATDALIDAGVSKSLISAKSMGDSAPQGSNSTPEGRAKNRRVEISVRNL